MPAEPSLPSVNIDRTLDNHSSDGSKPVLYEPAAVAFSFCYLVRPWFPTISATIDEPAFDAVGPAWGTFEDVFAASGE